MSDGAGTLRPALLADAPQIAQIARDARAAAMPWLPVLHTLKGDISFYTRRVLPTHTVDVVERDGAVAGFVSCNDDWIDHLYITPTYWRQGIGSRLLERALQSAPFLQLWVFQRNLAAQEFYRRHGFEVAERTDGRNNEEKCPDLRMTWTKAEGGRTQ